MYIHFSQRDKRIAVGLHSANYWFEPDVICTPCKLWGD